VITLVIDASVAVKWVVEEEGTRQALALRGRTKLIAPELLIAECANILWKKIQRKELSRDEGFLAARLIQAADVELLPMRSLLDVAARMAADFDHPAYDCVYLALAAENDCQFVTADERLVRKLGQRRWPHLRSRAISLAEAAAQTAADTGR
jgi:predicted nucleic acid-binding protein